MKLSGSPPKPYIGVTAFTYQNQVPLADAAQEKLKDFGKTNNTNSLSHIFVPGMLVSAATVENNTLDPRYVQNLAILGSIVREMRNKQYPIALHFTFDGQDEGAKQDNWTKSVYDILGIVDTASQGERVLLQLNGFSTPQDVCDIRKRFPVDIILQIREATFQSGSEEIASKVRGFHKLIRYVLLDPSQGRGQSIENNQFIAPLTQLNEQFQDIISGVAGGFNCQNAPSRLQALRESVGNNIFSVDITSGVLRFRKDQPTGEIVKEKFLGYVDATLRGFYECSEEMVGQ